MMQLCQNTRVRSDDHVNHQTFKDDASLMLWSLNDGKNMHRAQSTTQITGVVTVVTLKTMPMAFVDTGSCERRLRARRHTGGDGVED